MFVKATKASIIAIIFSLSITTLQAMHQKKRMYYFSHEQVLNCFKNFGNLDLEEKWNNNRKSPTFENDLIKDIGNACSKILAEMGSNNSLVLEDHFKTIFGMQNQKDKPRCPISIGINRNNKSDLLLKTMMNLITQGLNRTIIPAHRMNTFPDISICININHEDYCFVDLTNLMHLIPISLSKEEEWTSYDEYLSDVWKYSSPCTKTFMFILATTGLIVFTGSLF